MNEYANYRLKDITQRHLWLIDIAKNLKPIKQNGRVFICCFAIKGSNIITIACNDYISEHPRKKFGVYKKIKYSDLNNYKPGVHAEIKCLKQLGPFREDFNKMELFIIRIHNGKNDKTMIARPCDNCCRILKQFNFKKICFTTGETNKIGEMKLKS